MTIKEMIRALQEFDEDEVIDLINLSYYIQDEIPRNSEDFYKCLEESILQYRFR